ncbi:hypothetical protein [Prosthecobacter sp.]|uniref:hypothetical protein n=1 Tax=Prosthecobacter sp. TaxID=1965333 RepID=UPI003784AA1D
MNPHATNLECSLVCPLHDTCTCLRHLVHHSVLSGGHLGGSQLSGVMSLYYPQPLPPCVHSDGTLHWNEADSDLDEVPWQGDAPAL